MNGLRKFVMYWKDIFSAQDPIKALGLSEYERELGRFQIEVAPEPFYGYFHEEESMSNDVLLLLLNPGAKDERTNDKGWNDSVKARYVNLWSKDEYLRQEEILRKQNPWRDKRLNQTKGIVGDVEFLHTMEFFPFHSKKDVLTENFKRKWVSDFQLADLTYHALKDIAVNRKVKQIFSVSNDWIRFFEKYGVPLEKEVILKKHKGKEYSFAFKMYRFSEGGLPILFCDLNGSPVNLPRNAFAVRVSQIMLGIVDESLPDFNSDFDIIIKKW